MKTEYCSDAIALYKGKLVMVERLSFPLGYAIPGGRRDIIVNQLESIDDCAVREFEEETGLILKIDGEVGTYDKPGRDPRGPKISDVVYGRAYGQMRDEPGKTKVFLMDLSDIERYKDNFAFDHYEILCDWKGSYFLEK
ncbi:NUDIX domain-containing protein [Nanoarchaeota archaeon]